MSHPVQILRLAGSVAPLGLRFWDRVGQRLIDDGLEVVATPADGPGRPVTAYVNRSAIYVLRGLPGLRDAEAGLGDAAYWAEVEPRPFTIVVRDRAERFLPLRFTMLAPARGVQGWPCAAPAPADQPAAVPLFSAPTRATAAGMAVVRAQLRTAAGAPAAWAIVEAQANGGPVAQGMAAADGTLALFFPFPSPPAAGGRPPLLHQQTWALQIGARYSPATPPPAEPELCAALAQLPATLWADAAESVALTDATLTYGQELTLRTRDDDDNPLSELRIRPA